MGNGVDINIDDILIDPSLDEAVEELERKKAEAVQPSISIDTIIEKPKVDINGAITKIFDDKYSEGNSLASVVNEPLDTAKDLIANDPDELYEKSISPGDIIQQLIIDPVKNDLLCSVVKRDDSTNSLLNHVMREIAEELAYLKSYRKVHYLANEDISDISLKRVKSLKSLVETVVEKEKLKNNAFEGKIDFYGEKFEKVMEYILGVVKDAFDKVGIPDQYSDIFFTQLAQDLEGFEKKVEKIYYGTASKK